MSANHPQAVSQEWTTTVHLPPLLFSDCADREVEIDVYGEYLSGDEFEPLVGLYGAFNSADRKLGLPPSGGERIREWLETLLNGHNVLAWHDDIVAGHATLLEVRSDVYELGIFIHRAYQHSGIKFQLLTTLLEYGKRNGVENVRLIVERQQPTAVRLYQKLGFNPTNPWGFELEMVQEL
jgi:GNAT superfamily N-acetyltransferase